MSLAKPIRDCIRTGLLASIALFAWPNHAHSEGAKTHAYLIYDTPIFRNAAQSFSDVSAAKGYHSILLSNISESLSPDWDGNLSENPKGDLLNTLSSVIQADLKSGKIGKGHQVLIQVLTHGAKRSGSEATHSVQIGDQSVSLDTLKTVLKDLTQAGVRVGIIDGSCYSGATLALKSKNVCVVSSQDATQMATEDSRKNGTFVDFFWSELKKRNPKETISLESAFLNTRSQRNSLSTTYAWQFDRPELSSSRAQDLLAPLFRSFDKVHAPGASSLDCSVLNLKEQIQFLESLSSDVFKGINQQLAEKMTKYSEGKIELEKLNHLLDPFQGSSKEKNPDEALYLRKRDLSRKVDALETEIYQLEASLYKEYHEELRSKSNSEDDPCCNFQL